MLAEVFLIGKTSIDWKNLLSIAKQALGRSISQGIDTQKMGTDTLAAFICVCDEMLAANSAPLDSLRDAGVLLDHVHYSFLVIADSSVFQDLLQHSNLRVNVTQSQVFGVDTGIVSGTLLIFREAIINLINVKGQALRVLLDKIMLLLEAEGFKEIFCQYKKQTLPDRTFKLIEKK